MYEETWVQRLSDSLNTIKTPNYTCRSDRGCCVSLSCSVTSRACFNDTSLASTVVARVHTQESVVDGCTECFFRP